ncbi:oxidoreductase [Mycetocola tolaasinivorans]|uniref:Oxidoreductase n=1 Tax=Mycetocola tolaasinivorans TaxID=76635 RepID=A0A3L6ZZT5_9MICO|nr:MDR family oxidoreductase [Mycetocola tolaasinivorans]RLP72692.1 oxidoreductase [Mycetocola tolaasinivorans]
MSATESFSAWWVSEQSSDLRSTHRDELGPGDTLVRVEFSGINYKDGLALQHKPGVLRGYPMIPGIDLVGFIEESELDQWQPGERVLLNGSGLGETHNGGLAQYARVAGSDLITVPQQISNFRAAAIGTAGFTAMLSVLALEDAGLTPEAGPVLVTGAAGGVGSIAITLLSGLGYEVVAASGRADSASSYLTELGARRIIPRTDLSEPGRPLQSQEFAAVVDSVGSHTLVNALARLNYGGLATVCGLAQGPDLPGTVLPFILRGVHLIGINSVYAPRALRERAWKRLARDLNLDHLDSLTRSIPMSEVGDAGARILAGELRGRTVVDVDA